jgi:hypothetical protein
LPVDLGPRRVSVEVLDHVDCLTGELADCSVVRREVLRLICSNFKTNNN